MTQPSKYLLAQELPDGGWRTIKEFAAEDEDAAKQEAVNQATHLAPKLCLHSSDLLTFGLFRGDYPTNVPETRFKVDGTGQFRGFA